MRLNPLGEELIIVDELGQLSPAYVAGALEKAEIKGLIETAQAWDSVGVYLDPEIADMASLSSILDMLQPEAVPHQGKIHQVPCCFELGEDLEDLAQLLDLSVPEVVSRLTESSWPIKFLGFQPGFPYCGPLPSPFDKVPRKSSPRTRVPAGSAAVAAGQLGIYPAESPGGWQLVGRTPLTICDPQNSFFPFAPGDEIQLVTISQNEFEEFKSSSL